MTETKNSVASHIEVFVHGKATANTLRPFHI
jgi:hypothetical protein